VRARLLVAAGIAAAAAAVGTPRVSLACDSSTCAPQLMAVTPQQVVLDGKPLHITLQGAALSNVSGVSLSPIAPISGFTVFNDATILVTLPASTPAGIYSVRVIAPQGGSDPNFAPQFQVFPAPPPSQAPTPTPKATPTPSPTPTPTPPAPDSGVIYPSPAAAHGGGTPPPPAAIPAGGGPASPASAPIDIMAGLALGALVYLLWGSPRRLSGSWRRAPMAHLVGRPVQALHIGRICLYCGKLHLVFQTRRDIWKEGRYCGPKCFISAEAMPSPLAEEDEPEPVVEHKKAAWWRAAVATDQGPIDVDGAESWRPRF